MGRNVFRLTKWYGDCIGEDGTAFIAYWARLRWGLLRIPFHSTLRAAPGAPTRTRASAWPEGPPVRAGDALAWRSRSADFEGRWLPRQPGHHAVLLDEPGGSIRWHCEVPLAAVAIEQKDCPPLRGLGYAERLELTVKPWGLPFDTLRWGRILSEHDSVTWIAWTGASVRQWVFHNGVPQSEPSVLEPHRVSAAGLEVAIEPLATLRSGPLLSTALRSVPGKPVWLGNRFATAFETKWIGRGVLRPGQRVEAGWAIYEEVRFR